MALLKHHVTQEIESATVLLHLTSLLSMSNHSFAINDIDLNNVINIGMVFIDKHVQYHIIRRLTGFGYIAILNTRVVNNPSC